MDQEQEMRKAFEFAWLRALGAPDLALRNVLDGKRLMESAWQDFMSTRVESKPLRTGSDQRGGFADVSDFDENDPRSTI